MPNWKTRIFGPGWDKQYSRSIGREGVVPDWSEWRNFNGADLGDTLGGLFGVDRYGNNLATEPAVPRQEAERLAASLAKPMRDDPTILLLSANPETGTVPLQLQREERSIRSELEKSLFGRRFRLEARPKVIYADLQRYLLEVTPTILHFSGHGVMPGIIVENERGEPHLVPANNLSVLLSLPIIREQLQLVVLNACLSASQARAIATHIDVVVGMSNNVGDQAAIAFASGLYMALGTGLDVKSAFQVAVNAIGIDNLDNIAEEDTPQIFVRSRVDASQVYPLKT